mgnify:CR=1 FL=1
MVGSPGSNVQSVSEPACVCAHQQTTDPPPPLSHPVQPGRMPVLTTAGMQAVQSTERVFYLTHQQLDAAQRDPENHRVQVRGFHAWLAAEKHEPADLRPAAALQACAWQHTVTACEQ